MLIQLKKLSYKAVLLSMALGLLGFTIALAASGDLDSTFDGDGRVTSFALPSSPARNDTARGIAVQPDGKIVAAGFSYFLGTPTSDFALTRYNTDGSLDNTFSADGRLVTNFSGIDQAFDVAMQANGKIVAAGQKCDNTFTTCDVALARYNANGTLDTTFSTDGKQTSDFGGDDNGSFGGVAIQSNGKIVVVGYMWSGTDYDFAVYRYLANGSLDTTFSGDGMVNINFGAGRQDFAEDMVIQSNGKIVVAGETGDANYNNNNFAIVRLNAGGSIDTTFSGDGKQITNFGADDYADGIALQPDGKIVVAGERYVPSTNISSFALARYNTDGTPDTTFNGTGRKVLSVIAGMSSFARDVIVQSDGKIVTIGGVFNGSLNDFALVRLNSGGGLDTTFSGDGKVTIEFGGDEIGRALAIQPSDGKYVLAGQIDTGTQLDFALARVLP